MARLVQRLPRHSEEASSRRKQSRRGGGCKQISRMRFYRVPFKKTLLHTCIWLYDSPKFELLNLNEKGNHYPVPDKRTSAGGGGREGEGLGICEETEEKEEEEGGEVRGGKRGGEKKKKKKERED